MIATVEIGRIFKTDCIDNSQVCCIAEALVGFADEGLACRFVNKQLEESEISGVTGFPPAFPIAKFIQVNQLWKRQGWISKHRLAGVKSGLTTAKSKTTKIPAIAVSAPKGILAGASDGDSAEACRIKNELLAKLDRANEELKLAIEAKVKAEADAHQVKTENSKLIADLEAVRNDAELKGRSLEVAKKKMVEAIRTVTELKAEKAKNEAMLAAIRVTFPEEVSALGLKLAKGMPDTAGARRVIYLYLAMITADPIEDLAFGNRFKLFDDELYLLFKDDPAKLKQTREMFASDINARLTGQRVTWNFLGEPFNTEKFTTSDSFGTEVTEVISALITKVNGSVVRRAKVKTEDVNAEN